MKRIVIYPYKIASKSATLLQETFIKKGYHCIRVHPDRKYRPRESDVIINWGSSTNPVWIEDQVDFNSCECVGRSSNKLSTFIDLETYVNIPRFTTKINTAKQWTTEGYKVFCRTILNSHSGKGIIIADTPEKVVPAPLYTLEFKKTNELRLHVVNNSVLLVQEKRRRNGFNGRTNDIWNSDNEYVYCKNNIVIPNLDYIKKMAIQAVEYLGLNFAAIDIGYNQQTKEFVIFEVNTAPGLTPSTAVLYVDAFLNTEI